MKVQKHTVQWRLMLWGQWVQEPRTELAQSFSPFGKFAEMQENSNARADGIIYEIIDGTPCPPDGGLARAVEYRANIIMHNQRCKDVNEALGWLTAQMRRTIETTYIVPGKGEPRSIAHVADLMNLSPSTVKEALNAAHKRVANRIYGTFELIDDAEMEAAA